MYQKPVPEDLRAVTTIDLSSDIDVYEAFKEAFTDEKGEITAPELTFIDETHEVVITL